jgi:site-specific recombinase XerD
VIVDLYGKGGHIRTVPIPEWVKTAIDCWTTAAPVTSGRIFRCVSKTGTVWGEGVSGCVVKEFASKAQLGNLAPHDLRRTCARLCHVAGGELEQIQFLLGHVSVQTTESTSGANRNCALQNDHIGIEPED